MEIKETFNTSKEEIESKKYNIFIPICLGNKFFSVKNIPTDNVKKYLDWSLNYTKEKVLILVVDKIQDTNYIVRNSTNSEEQNLRRLFKDGKIVKENLERLVLNCFQEYKEKINIINWKVYEKEDPHCSKTSHLLYKELKNNKEFRESVLNAVKNSITDRKFSEEKYFRLCDYLLDEFSLAYSGTEYDRIHYNLFPYPNPDASSDFVFGIQSSKIFPKLNKKLPMEKTALAIVN